LLITVTKSVRYHTLQIMITGSASADHAIFDGQKGALIHALC
jgi:hypothetical protein